MKKSLIALVMIGSVAAAGVFYVNMMAEDAIKQQLEQANQSYRDMAAIGDMPEFSISYKEVSANVLTSSYSISDMAVAMGEMGTVATIDYIQAKGMKPQSLSDKGSVKLSALKRHPPHCNCCHHIPVPICKAWRCMVTMITPTITMAS